MHTNSDFSTNSAVHRMNPGQSPKDHLNTLRQDVANETYRLQSLEQCLQQAKDAVYALEANTMGSVFASLTGSRDRKLAARQTELRTVQDRYDDTLERLKNLKRELERVEAEVASMPPQPAGSHQTVTPTDRTPAPSGGSSTPMSGDDRIRQIQTAIERGKTLLERLHSLTSAVGRVKNRGLGGRPLGALGSLAMNVVGAQGVKMAVQRVQEGLRSFNEKLAEIEFRERTELDLELVRLTAETQNMEAAFSARSVTDVVIMGASEGPMMAQIQNFLGLLDAKVDKLSGR